jgi:DNA primase
MAFSREVLDAIKDRADIVQIIGEKVNLTPSGGNYKGLCPFHGEKTASFMVNASRRMYHCFGCGAGGSVIDFVMAYERVDFPQALRSLAERVGIALETERGRPSVEPGLKALEAAQRYYHERLLSRPEGEPGRAYLRGRTLDEDAWKAFGLGFAPDGWRGLVEHAQRSSLAVPDLVSAGLAKNGPSGQPYDLLRKRVVFPILGERGRCIAFGGRVIDPADNPKYLNTPETPFYHKHRVLYGMVQGQEALRKERRAILCEGYLDVMRLHLHGFKQAVATCGTALTEEHLKLLERSVDRVALVFDGDEAGVKAALRSAPLFLNRGLEARVVLLPDGLDPDDFLRRDGAEAFGAHLERAVPLLEFLVFQTLRRNGRTPHGKEKALQALLPVLSAIRKEAVRDVTVRYVADLAEVKAASVFALLDPKPGRAAQDAPAPSGTLLRRERRHQRMFLHLLLGERELIGRARELLRPDDLSDPAIRSLFETMLRFTDAEFRELDLDELTALHPELAEPLRALLVEEPLALRSLAGKDKDWALRDYVARIKEEEKERLFQHLKRVAGTPEEDLAVRRFVRMRDDLRDLRMPEAGAPALAPGDAPPLAAGNLPS